VSTLTRVIQQAAIAAGDQHTVEAAVHVLRAGGNAVDAVVGAGFAAAVAEPCLTSLGGGGFLLHRAPDGTSRLFDFFVDAPGRGLADVALSAFHFEPITLQFAGTTQTFHCGYGSVAVPGVLAGYLKAHAALGRLSLAQVVAPAVRLAREGFILGVAQAGLFDLLSRIVTATPEAASVFGHYLEGAANGSKVANPLYANFLDELVDTVDHTSTPDWQHRLVRAMQQNEGLVSADDLAAYQVVERVPLTFDLADATLLTNPPPAFGGAIVGSALTGAYGGHATRPMPGVVTMLQALVDATATGKKATAPTPRSTKGTTQISIIDSEGGIASMTTSNGSCSGVMIPGTGIQLNNVMGEADLHPHGFHRTEPGTRIASMMAPSIITWPDGSSAALGSGGSERIRSAIVQVAAAVLAGQSAREAVDAPRMHVDDNSVVQAEPGITDEKLEAVGRAWRINVWAERDLYFGGANLVHRDAAGALTAAGDPRRGGSSAVFDL